MVAYTPNPSTLTSLREGDGNLRPSWATWQLKTISKSNSVQRLWVQFPVRVALKEARKDRSAVCRHLRGLRPGVTVKGRSDRVFLNCRRPKQASLRHPGGRSSSDSAQNCWYLRTPCAPASVSHPHTVPALERCECDFLERIWKPVSQHLSEQFCS